MVKRENAITVDIVKAIVIRNYIKFGEHVKKIEMKFFMAGSIRNVNVNVKSKLV